MGGGNPPQTPHNTIPPRTAIFITQSPRFALGLDKNINNSRSNFVRVTILVHDDNDHAPEFLSPLIQTRLHETAAVGAEVVEVLAVDNDQACVILPSV